MTEESEVKQAGAVATGKSLDMLEKTLYQFLKSAEASAVYGEPVREGDVLLLPTAEVVAVLGFGVGEGGGSGPEGTGGGSGEGGGGGGKTYARPVSVVVVSPQGVEVKHILDVTKVALAALTTWGFIVGMALRMLRRPSGH